MMRRLRLLPIALLGFSLGATARETKFTDFNSQWFKPATGGDGLATTEGARPGGDGDERLDFKLWLLGEQDPFAISTGRIYNRVIGWASLSVRVNDTISVFGQLNATLTQNGRIGEGYPFYRTAPLRTSGAGESQLGLRWAALRQDRAGVNLALKGSLSLAT